MTQKKAEENPIRVVLLDDHHQMHQIVRTTLGETSDIKLIGQGANGDEGAAPYEQYQPDIVLMGLIMPNMDGVEATLRVKRVSPRSQLVILTSYHEDENVFPALKAGARSYILKDLSAEELASAVRKAAIGEAVLHPPP